MGARRRDEARGGRAEHELEHLPLLAAHLKAAAVLIYGQHHARFGAAAEMHDAVMDALPSQQIVVKAAAVSDFTPADVADSKIKKRDELTLALKKAPDILADVGASSPRPFIVAFAAETDDLESNAREKLVRKNADLIVANNVADASIGFDSDQNAVTVIARDGSSMKIERAPKIVIANRILDLVVERLGS